MLKLMRGGTSLSAYVGLGARRTKPRTKADASKRIAYWLFGGSGLVCGMVVLGGWTRLTESGLSMVDWQLIHFCPPKGQLEWLEYFEKYKQFPEYKVKNNEMTLDEFKRIYYYEHFHRVLGRITGAYFLVPSLFLTLKGLVKGAMLKRIWTINGLLAFQGGLGWYMVKSGLRDEIAEQQLTPRVSPLRLTAHLGCAFLIHAMALRTGMLALQRDTLLHGRLRRMHRLCSLFIGLTALSGGMVAGWDAGLLYDTFPRMGNSFLPAELLGLTPWWCNFTYNATTVQFVHRYLAKGTWLMTAMLWLFSRRFKLDNGLHRKFALLFGIGTLQASLGIATLLTHVDIRVASLHQAGSLALFTTSLLI